MINILDKLINNKKPVVDEPIRCNKIEKLLDAKQQLEKNLKEGEMICSKCEGVGFVNKIESEDTSIYKDVCPKCHGTGKLDWIENVLGKNPQFHSSSSFGGPSISSKSLSFAWNTDDLPLYGTSGLTDEIVKQAADHIAKKIDDEILEILRRGG